MNKKILIVTHWFYPRQNPRAFRAFELYRQLAVNNEVEVLIGDWKVLLRRDQDYHLLDKYDTSLVNGKNATFSNSKFIQIGLKIVQYFIGERYILNSGKFIKKNIELSKYDAIISIGLPFYVHWIVAKKINKYKGKIVSISDWGDPFYGDSGKKVAKYFKYIQKFVCETFDYIVIPTSNAMNYYKNYTSDQTKIKVIPQGFDFSEVKVSEYKQNRIPHFAYAGIFYLDKRNPELFLEFLTTLETDFVFTIYTITHGEIYQRILLKYKRILKSKLVIHDMVSRLECIRLLSKNDFLINIDNMSNVQVPSKLIDYSLSGRPVLSFRQDEIPCEKFKAFLKGVYDNALEISIDDYDIKKISLQFENLINGG